MIHELRRYSMKYGETKTYLDNFRKFVVPNLAETDHKLVGAWTTLIGPGVRADFHYLLQWESLAEREVADKKLHDASWYPEFSKGAQHLSGAQIVILEPVDFSPLR